MSAPCSPSSSSSAARTATKKASNGVITNSERISCDVTASAHLCACDVDGIRCDAGARANGACEAKEPRRYRRRRQGCDGKARQLREGGARTKIVVFQASPIRQRLHQALKQSRADPLRLSVLR